MKKQTLARKILFAIIPSTLGLILVLSAANYYTAKREILGGVDRQITILARQASDNTTSFFAQRRRDASEVAASSLLRDYLKYADYGLTQEAESYRHELSRYFGEFARKAGVYSRISFLDANGRELAVGMPAELSSAAGSPPDRELLPGRVLDSGLEPGQEGPVHFWTGVFDEQERLVGRVVLACELTPLRNLLGRMRIGDEGRAFLVDARGRELLAASRSFPGPIAADAAVAGTPWRVRLEAKPAEFLAPLRKIQRWTWVVLVGMGFISFLWIIYWSRSLTRPIEEMAAGTRRLAAGDLDFRFHPPEIRELRVLGEAFNEMAARLKERNQELEAHIRELTALREMEGAVIQRLDEESILRTCLKAIAAGLAFDRAGLYWVDAKRGELAGRYVHGAESMGLSEEAFSRRRLPLDSADILCEVVRARAAVLVKDPEREDPRLNPAFVRESKTNEFVMAPICGKDRVFGVLVADNCRGGRPLSVSDKDGLTLFANAVGLAIENAELFQGLSASEARYRSVLENSPIAILGLSGQQWVTTWNLGAEQIFGYTAQEILGKPLRSLFPAETGEEFSRLLSEVIERGSVRDQAITGMTKDGRRIDLSLSWGGALPDFWLNKEWTVVIRDVTESKKLQQQVIRSEKLSAVGQLISGITHELNNPLQVVVGYAQMLSQSAKGALQKDLRQISDAALRCRKIIDNLLVFVRQGKVEMHPVSVSTAAKAALELLQYKLKSANVTAGVVLPKSLPKVRADGQQLQQVLINLIGNACDAMAGQPGEKRIEIRARTQGETVRVEVADSGPGIPAALRARIFDPFFTTKPEGRGTGLGLAICRQIIAEHGGAIGVADRDGPGAVFWLEVPIERDGAAAPRRRTAAVPRIEGKRILVIDDDEPVVVLMQRVLSEWGGRVDEAASFAEAAELGAETAYDLVVCGVRVEDGRGLDLRSAWIERTGRPAPAFLYLTGDVLNTALLEECERLGLPVLHKPIDPMDLLQAAHGLLHAPHAG